MVPLSRSVSRISSWANPAKSVMSGSPMKFERTVVHDPSTPVVIAWALPVGNQESCTLPPPRTALCQSLLSWKSFRFSFQLR